MLKGYEEYKRSDSNWITKVPAHWKVTTLRALLKNVSEKNYPHKELLSKRCHIKKRRKQRGKS